MKYIIIIILALGISTNINGTDPIKRKNYFVSFDISYPFYNYYNQALFNKKGLGLGGAVSIGHQKFPVYAEYFYQSPLFFKYRNNEVKEQYQEIGLRYNLNHLTYLFPYGLDPYLGIGLIQRKSQFSQYAIVNEGAPEFLSQNQQQTLSYKISSGVKFGNKNIVVGIHYDFLPSKFVIPNEESTDLTIYNSLHMFSFRVGIRLFSNSGKKIKCPRFNKKVKRTLSF